MAIQQHEAARASSAQKSDQQYRSVMQRFKAEAWSDEKLTQELMNLAGTRQCSAVRASSPAQRKTTDLGFLLLKGRCKKEGWSEEKYTKALMELANNREAAHYNVM